MLVLFDIDGTLLDDAAATASGVAALHAHLEPYCSVDEFARRWQCALDTHFQRFDRGEIDFFEQRRARVREVVDAAMDDASADAVFEVYLSGYEFGWRLYDDVIPALDAVSACRLGIVSNGQGAQQRAKLARTGVLERFDPIVISAEVEMRKPSASIFLEACSRAGTSPGDAVHVGDRYEADALGARCAGLTGAWLDRSGERTGAHHGPVLGSLLELVSLL